MKHYNVVKDSVPVRINQTIICIFKVIRKARNHTERAILKKLKQNITK